MAKSVWLRSIGREADDRRVRLQVSSINPASNFFMSCLSRFRPAARFLAALPIMAGSLAAADSPAAVRAERVGSGPIIREDMLAGTSINGPSLIRVPSWVKNPLGKYYSTSRTMRENTFASRTPTTSKARGKFSRAGSSDSMRRKRSAATLRHRTP